VWHDRTFCGSGRLAQALGGDLISTRVCAAVLLVVTFLIGACHAPTKQQVSTTPVATASERELPPIESSYTRNGRGVPYGRSDSDEAYVYIPLPVAKSPDYGFTKENPVKVGPRNDGLPHIRYLNSLRGPNGEVIEYERKGSCCPFEAEQAPLGALLDIYRLKTEGSSKDIYIFVDMYTSGTLQIPVGLTQRK
jgi:hypothetical protein